MVVNGSGLRLRLYHIYIYILVTFFLFLFACHKGYIGWDGGQWVAETNGGRKHHSSASHPARNRLMDVHRLLKPIVDRGTKMHFEFASVSDIGFMKELQHLPITLADSIGANEQELGILWNYLTSGNMQYVAPHAPRVAQVSCYFPALEYMREFNFKLTDSAADLT